MGVVDGEVAPEASANDEGLLRNTLWVELYMLHARAGMYRLTPPVVARGAPQLTRPRYRSEARGVVQACSA